ncbi:MAG: DinB family protein [Bacteroidetes bacterium]|nr:DinB family protein [Bacteroidota bacterium]
MENLKEEVRKTGVAIVESLNRYSEEDLNEVPYEGGWTAGQVGEHLIKSGGVADVVFGRVEPTLRPPDEKLAVLRMFLDFSIKMKSPDFILPSAGYHDKKEIVEQLGRVWDRLGEAVETLDMKETCVDFEMPMVGKLTRLEWISFQVYHTKRHMWQLEKIYDAVVVKSGNSR